MPQLQGCRLLFWSPSQPKRSRESRYFLKKFSQLKVMCWQRKKLKVENIANYLVWFGCTHITYLLHTFFGQQNVENELFSTTWKFPNINRNTTSLVVGLKTAPSLLEKEQETPVLHRLTSAGSQKKLWNVFRRQNLKLSCSDFLDVWSKFNVLV